MGNRTICADKGHLGTVALPANSPLVRERPRPPALRQEGYDDVFDFHTVFYDAFFMDEGNRIRFVGPLLLNFEPYVKAATLTLTDPQSGERVRAKEFTLTNMNKLSRLDIVLERPLVTAICTLDMGELGCFTVEVQPNGYDLFKGMKVGFTMFKYEPLSWVVDWVEFNVTYHGMDALLIYHNDSPDYETQEIYDALMSIEGLDALYVARWPFKFGPGAGGSGLWDSKFCQIGMVDHARSRFLEQAKAVFFGDIDELIVTQDHVSIFDLLERSTTGYFQVQGINIAGSSDNADTLGKSGAGSQDIPFGERRHRHYAHTGTAPYSDIVGCKWVLDPSVVASHQQWMIHGVFKGPADRGAEKQATLCHFRDINVGWKRRGVDPLVDVRVHEPLVQAFQRIGWR